jgi:hypothetical protein
MIVLITRARRKAVIMGLVAATLARLAPSSPMRPRATNITAPQQSPIHKSLPRGGIVPISIVRERAAAKVWVPRQCGQRVLAMCRTDQ